MQYLTPKDVMGILQLSKNTVYALFNREDFPSVQIGKQLRVSKEDFEEYMKKQACRKADAE